MAVGMLDTNASPRELPSENEAVIEKTRKRQATAYAACRLRKVKCSRTIPCTQCAHTGLTYIYKRTASQSRARRGKVIIDYRRQTSTSSPTLPYLLPSTSESTCELDKTFFLNIVPDYVSHVFATYPVIAEAEVRQNIKEMGSNDKVLSFIYTLTAYTMVLVSIGIEKSAANRSATIHLLVDKSIRRRKPVASGFTCSVRICMTSLFLHLHFSSMRDAQASSFYLREAAVLQQMLGADDRGQANSHSQFKHT